MSRRKDNQVHTTGPSALISQHLKANDGQASVETLELVVSSPAMFPMHLVNGQAPWESFEVDFGVPLMMALMKNTLAARYQGPQHRTWHLAFRQPCGICRHSRFLS